MNDVIHFFIFHLPSATPVAPVTVPFVVVFLFLEVVLAAQDVEAIDDAKHAVLVDGVVARVSAHEGIDGSADVGLLTQDVVDFEHHGKGATTEE